MNSISKAEREGDFNSGNLIDKLLEQQEAGNPPSIGPGDAWIFSNQGEPDLRYKQRAKKQIQCSICSVMVDFDAYKDHNLAHEMNNNDKLDDLLGKGNGSNMVSAGTQHNLEESRDHQISSSHLQSAPPRQVPSAHSERMEINRKRVEELERRREEEKK